MMRVDGREVAARGTLLEACRAAGAEVPALCHDDRLSRGGHCRSCLVEVNGRCVAACTQPAREGLDVRTQSAKLAAYRRDLGELMRAEAEPRREADAALRAWGVTGERYARGEPRGRDASHPYLRLDLDACILCRRCVRACEEIQGQFVFAIEGRGAGAHLSWSGGPFAASGCVSCGACVTACPSGALSDVDRERAIPESRVVRTTCGYCGVGCQLEVHASETAIARIEGADSPVNRGHLCVKGRFAHGFVRHPERLRSPLIRRDGALVETSWDDALAFAARELARLDGRIAGLSSSRCTNEENYLFQKWLRGGLGTNDVDCCARVCHAPSAAGMRAAFGTGAATNSLDDIERADLLLVVGANPTEAHPVTGARLRQAALSGATLIVVDPRRTELAEIADIHLAVRPGANVPLLHALAATIVEEGLVNREFLAARVEGWESYESFVRAYSPESVEPLTGVSAPLVRDAARRYARAARPFMAHGLGITEHLQGSEAVMLLCNLALLVGALGREGVGVNPLRGQNNVQGAADMGCQPDRFPGDAPVADDEARARIGRVWGRELPSAPGRTLPAMWDAIERGEIRGLILFGEDVAQTDPDARRVRRLLDSLEFVLVLELFPSETAKHATVVLPGASFLEKDGTFTNGERRIQRVRAVLPPLEGCRPDWRILLDLMAATGWPQALRSPAEVMSEIARVAPRFAGATYDRLEQDGVQWPAPASDHPGTPILHRESFPRGKGLLSRVEFVPSPELRAGLTLVTGRRLEHYNAGTMTRRTPNETLAPLDELEISPADARERGIETGARVRVASARGAIEMTARVTASAPSGTVFTTFHHPETPVNELTSNVRDRISDCPEYKITAVEVSRAG